LGDPLKNTTLWAAYYSRLLNVVVNVSTVFVGHFDGHSFEPLFEQPLDFGAAYAFLVIFLKINI
jgi:hypothetical protein